VLQILEALESIYTTAGSECYRYLDTLLSIIMCLVIPPQRLNRGSVSSQQQLSRAGGADTLYATTMERVIRWLDNDRPELTRLHTVSYY
jgi:hypothetical protein